MLAAGLCLLCLLSLAEIALMVFLDRAPPRIQRVGVDGRSLLGRVASLAYVGLSTVIVSVLLLVHASPGSDVADLARQIRFDGVAVTVPAPTGASSTMRLRGSPVERGATVPNAFRWRPLPPGGEIRLEPETARNGAVAAYRVVVRGAGAVVRTRSEPGAHSPLWRLRNGRSSPSMRALNETVGAWVKSGADGTYQIGSVGFRLLNQGEAVGVATGRDATGSHKVLNFYPLRSLLAKAGAGSLARRLDPLLARDGKPLLDRLLVVRRLKDDSQADIALVDVSAPPEGDPGTGAPAATPVSRLDGGPAPDYERVVCEGPELRLEIVSPGKKGGYAIALRNAPEETPGGVRFRFEFDPPLVYPLPPADLLRRRGGRVQIASSALGVATDGYLFDTGTPGESVVASGRLSLNPLKIEIQNQDPLLPDRPQVLGKGAVAPIVQLRDPVRTQSVPCGPILALLWLGALLCVSFLDGGRWFPGSVDVRRTYPALVVWVVASALLAVRTILAFRTACLPPYDAPGKYAAAFEGALPLAVQAMATLPLFLGIAVCLVVRSPAARKRKDAVQEPRAWLRELGSRAVRGFSRRPCALLSRLAYVGAPVAATYSTLLGIGLLVMGLLLGTLAQDYDPQGDGPGVWNLEDRVLSPLFTGVGVLVGAYGLLLGALVSAKTGGGFLLFALGLLIVAPGEAGDRPSGGFLRRVADARRAWAERPALFALAVLLLWGRDPGAFVFFVPLFIAVCVGALAKRFRAGGSRSWIGWAGYGLLATLSALILFAGPQMGGFVLARGWSPVAAHRMVAVDEGRATAMLTDSGAGAGFDPEEMLRALEQRWQMRTYVQAGGKGYFASPLDEQGMTYSTTLSDAAFSVFLVGEHGRAAGVWAVALIALLALALFHAAWTAARLPDRRAGALGLYAVASLLGTAGVYMGLANLWAVPFTGQNVPFLGLNSLGEISMTFSLALAAVVLVAFPASQAPKDGAGSGRGPVLGLTPQEKRRKEEEGNRERRARLPETVAWWTLPAALVAGVLVLWQALGRVEGGATDAFDLPDAYTQLQRTVDEAGAQRPLSDTPAVKASSAFIRGIVAKYDAGDLRVVAPRRGSSTALDVSPTAFRVASPHEPQPGIPWKGRLTARNAERRCEFTVEGSEHTISLVPGARSKNLAVGETLDAPIATAALGLYHRVPGRRRSDGTREADRIDDYGGISLDAQGRVVLRTQTQGKPGEVLLDGMPPEANERGLIEKPLEPGQNIRLVVRESSGATRRISLTYGEEGEPALAQTVWTNGRYARRFPFGGDFSAAAAIGDVLDASVRGKDAASAKADVALSLDLGLQRRLMAQLRSWSSQHGRQTDRLVRGGQNEPLFTALAILETGTGRVRALASVPQTSPLDFVEGETGRQAEDARQTAFSSWAFVNRPIGSTVKPLSFAALATQFEGSVFDLTRLRVNEQAAVMRGLNRRGNPVDRYRRLGDIVLGQGRIADGRRFPALTMTQYLSQSRTLPAIVTATIGLAHSADDRARQNRELRAMGAGATSTSLRPYAALRDVFTSPGMVSSQRLSETAFFSGLDDCYGPAVVPFNYAGKGRWNDGLAQTFLPVDASEAGSGRLRWSLPELHQADTTRLTDLEALVRYAYGAGENSWNAVTMAANGARVVSGYRVQPTLREDARLASDAMPAPLNRAEWRQAHLIEPLRLRNVTTLSAPDRASLGRLLPAGYDLFVKTGTIDDGAEEGARESEMAMFTVGPYDSRTGFDRGRSVSGFLSIRSSKLMERQDGDRANMVKGELLRKVLPELLAYLNPRFRR